MHHSDNRRLRRAAALGLLLCLSTTSLRATELVVWSSGEGMARLARAYKTDFFALANHYQTQPDQVLCGPTSAVIVMNTLRWNSPKAPFIALTDELTAHLPAHYDPRIRGYQVATFFTPEIEKTVMERAAVYGKPVNGKSDFGVPLEKLARLIQAHGFRASATHVENSSSAESVMKDLVTNLRTAGDYVLVNYTRKAVGQNGGGHFSPLGAYDETTQSFLVLDVNPSRAPWVWVGAKDLIGAMNTADGPQHRGYIQVSDTK